MRGVLDRLQDRAAASARRLGLFAGALALLTIGLGFLAAAGWMMLVEARGAVFAATVFGLGFAGTGLAAIGMLAATARRAPPPLRPDVAAAAGLLAEAFVAGLAAGRQARR